MYRLYLRAGVIYLYPDEWQPGWGAMPALVGFEFDGLDGDDLRPGGDGPLLAVNVQNHMTGGQFMPNLVYDPASGGYYTVVHGNGVYSSRAWFTFEADIDSDHVPTYAYARFLSGYWESLNVQLEASTDGVNYVPIGSGICAHYPRGMDDAQIAISNWPHTPGPSEPFWTNRILTTEYAR